MKQLNYQQRALLFTHLAAMENAGVPVTQSFKNLKLEAAFQDRLVRCRHSINKGTDIAQAAYSSGLFNYFEFTLIRAACAAGSPGLSYKRLAQVYKEKDILEKRLRARMRLPMLMLVMALFILRLPAYIVGSISMLQFLLGAILPLALIVAVIHYVKKHLRQTQDQPIQDSPQLHQVDKDRHSLDQLLLSLPFFGPMILRDNARQFFESLSLLLEAGVPMFEALPLATHTIWNSKIRPHYLFMSQALEHGRSLSQALESNPMTGEDTIIELVRTGEASGTLPAMIWRHVENETEAQTQFREAIANWLPKIIYGLVAAYIIVQIFKSGAFLPQLPEEAR